MTCAFRGIKNQVNLAYFLQDERGNQIFKFASEQLGFRKISRIDPACGWPSVKSRYDSDSCTTRPNTTTSCSAKEVDSAKFLSGTRFDFFTVLWYPSLSLKTAPEAFLKRAPRSKLCASEVVAMLHFNTPFPI